MKEAAWDNPQKSLGGTPERNSADLHHTPHWARGCLPCRLAIGEWCPCRKVALCLDRFLVGGS